MILRHRRDDMSDARELVATLPDLRVGVEDLLHRVDQQDKAGVSPIMGTEGSVRKQLPDRVCRAVVRGNERADTDVVVGIPGISGG